LEQSKSNLCTSGVTADIIVEESKPSLTERQYNKKINKLERQKKKMALKRYMRHIYRKKRCRGGKQQKEMLSSTASVRTHHEEIFESYLKLLGQPYLINQIFCFGCKNYFHYGDHITPPRKCQVCGCAFTIAGLYKKKKTKEVNHIARPDFILDFNNEINKARYKHDTHHKNPEGISEYRDEYMKKVGVIRIDGSIHQKKSQRIKDYWQYKSFREAGVKVFIVQNFDMDELLSINDNGRSLLKLCKYIGDCILCDQMYEEYCKGGDFSERVSCPF
jgi:hypothetical protein